ncbi:MAG: type II secretion system minor pseudopilin GspK [Methylophaga sp.]|nr:type II secretion system minor pseudopilin GspK [Methylophaga sp.]
MAVIKNQNNQQKGVALVVVLLVVALVSIIATDLTGRLQREIRRSANIFDHQQAQYYALGAEKFAIAIIQDDLKDSPDRDDLDQAWATKGLYFPVEGGDLTGVITDVNRCFNLNSLVAKQDDDFYIADKESVAYQSYQRLLDLLGFSTGLVEPLVDWLDSDSQPIGMDGAEDREYEILSPAYRAANNLIVDVSELRLVQGYSDDIVKKLSPYVCALPEDGYFQLNINTIDVDKPELLSMLIKDLSVQSAATLLAERAQSGYDDLASFWQLSALAGIEIEGKVKSVIQLNSDYYQLQAKARIGRGHEGLTTLFKQVDKEKVNIIWRRFGTLE